MITQSRPSIQGFFHRYYSERSENNLCTPLAGHGEEAVDYLYIFFINHILLLFLLVGPYPTAAKVNTTEASIQSVISEHLLKERPTSK
jgi:hypothetical protein